MSNFASIDDEVILNDKSVLHIHDGSIKDYTPTKIRFMWFGTYSKKKTHNQNNYPNTLSRRGSVYLVFHDDEKLGTKTYSDEACKHYINGFKGLIELNESGLEKEQLIELSSLVRMHNYAYMERMKK